MTRKNRGCIHHLAVVGILLAVFQTGLGQSAATLPPEVVAYADMIFYNGKIISADEQFTIAEAVAIRDGKFLAVGTTQRILAMAGPETQRVDLEGRSVVPGFIDTHLHSAWVTRPARDRSVPAPFSDRDINWDTLESALEGLRTLVEGAEPEEFFALSGPSNPVVNHELNRTILDQVAPDNPLYIEAMNDQVVANSLVLERIPKDVPGIVRDEDGELTGHLRGAAAGIPGFELEPWPEIESLMEPQKASFRRHNELGLTTLMGRAGGLEVTVFRDLMMRGELTMRVRVAHHFLRQNGYPEAYLKRLGNLTDFGNDWFKIIGTSVQVVDGTSSNGSANTASAKLKLLPGDPYGPFGMNKWEESGDLATSDRQSLILANRYGWSVSSLHSSGDMSNTLMLEAFEEAHQERSLVGRHFGIDHGLMLKPEHYEKIKEMDVIPSIYSKAMYGNDALVEMYGMDEVYKMQPVKSMIEAGIRPAAEADAFTHQTAAPLFNIQNWVTRIDQKGRQLDPEEKISREEALYLYTLWAAAYSGEQDILGSIEPGKLADLVVLAGDYMTFPETDLEKLRVLMTIAGGAVVYQVEDAF
ncbi:MAG: amidohydrolase family protein [Acidobacteriota bacterium]|nr:amidohydrolase family protein [Acidobacteriota bacterium]